MNRKIIAIAAALAAATTISDGANAGGVRLGFGIPLGSFVAHSASSQARYGGYGDRKCARPAATRSYSAVRHSKPAKTVVARQDEDETPARKVKRVAKSVETKVATTTKATATTDAAPSIFVPPTTVSSEQVAGTQSSPTPVKTAAIETGAVTDTVKTIDTAKTEEPATKDEEKTVTIEPIKNVKLEVPASVCRKFSAAIGQMIEIPCGD